MNIVCKCLAITAMILLFSQAGNAGEIDVGVGIGYVGPLINSKGVGDNCFGAPAGQEWRDIIGLNDVSGTYFIAGSVRFYIKKRIAIELDSSFWKKTETTKPSGMEDIEVENIFRDISLGVSILYFFNGQHFRPFFGGGSMLHFVRAEMNPVGFPEISLQCTKIKPGVSIQGGVEKALSQRMNIFIAGSYDPVSNWSRWKIYGGVRFHL